MPYSPFNKEVHEKLTADDLAALIEREVAEGYYVEYKGDFPDKNHKIGHSIASFANTYGGWYILGVKANKTKNVATEISGFDLSVHHDSIATMRDIIKSNIDPTPVFHPQLIVLENGRGVLVVYVPDNQETPFVTRDGRIYRRVNDSSDPVPETSRYSIDRLVDKGRNIAKQFEIFCTDNRGFSESERKNGWIKIFISPYPAGLIDKYGMLFDDNLEKMLSLSQQNIRILGSGENTITGNMPFNSCQLSGNSAILRYTKPHHAGYNTLSAELFTDGRARFYIPVQYLPNLSSQFFNKFESEEVKDTLLKILQEDKQSNTNHLRFVDIGQLWLHVAILFSYYLEWLKTESFLDEMKVAIIVDGMWRTVPIFDDARWAGHVKKFGLPVVLEKGIRIPENVGEGFTIHKRPIENEIPGWFTVLSLLAFSWGLPAESFFRSFGSAIGNAAKKKTPKD